LNGNDKKRFEQIFKDLFKPLCGFAVKYVGDLDESKNIVHEVFISVWEKFGSFPEGMNFRGYLFTATRNKCLNYIRDHKKEVSLDLSSEGQGVTMENTLEVKELEREIEIAINQLPEKCRMVFEMSRYGDLKYSEIAQKMNISVKTVEAHMSKALQILRKELINFLSLLLFVVGL